MADVSQLVRRLERLKTLRLPHEKLWRDCFDHSFTMRGSGLQQSNPLTAQQGIDRKARLLHSVATDAGRTLAAAKIAAQVPGASLGRARVAVQIVLHPPTARAFDLDNRLKSTLDAIQHAKIIDDDGQIDALVINRGEKVPGGRCDVTVIEIHPEA